MRTAPDGHPGGVWLDSRVSPLRMPGGGPQKKPVYGDEPSVSPAHVTSRRSFPVRAPSRSVKQTLGTRRGRPAVGGRGPAAALPAGPARLASSAGWRETPAERDGHAVLGDRFAKCLTQPLGLRRARWGLAWVEVWRRHSGLEGAAWPHTPLSGWLRTRDGCRRAWCDLGGGLETVVEPRCSRWSEAKSEAWKPWPSSKVTQPWAGVMVGPDRRKCGRVSRQNSALGAGGAARREFWWGGAERYPPSCEVPERLQVK